jgi:predicted RNase H-like nuclease (RuvC/YqgF family)
MILTLNSPSAKKISLLKDLAQKLGVEIIETPKRIDALSTNIPNAETLASMKKTNEGLKVKKFTNFDSLMNELNS